MAGFPAGEMRGGGGGAVAGFLSPYPLFLQPAPYPRFVIRVRWSIPTAPPLS